MTDLQADVDRALIAGVRGDATIIGLLPLGVDGVGPHPFPDIVGGARYPIVTVTPGTPGLDTNVVANDRALTSGLWIVRAIAPGQTIDEVEPVGERLDDAVNQLNVVVNGTRVQTARESTFRLDEVSEGTRYQHMGGVYRCWYFAD